MKNILIVFAAVPILIWVSNANALTVNYVSTPAQTTGGVDNYTTTSDMMAGMSVEFTWGDDSTTDFIWTAGVSPAGGISDSGGFTLGLLGDSFVNSWVLGNLAPRNDHVIKNIFIDAGTGGTVFDVVDGSDGTPNSAYGKPFEVTYSAGNFDITATYSGAVQIGGAAPVGDLYRYLNIDFTSTASYGNGNNYQGHFGVDDRLAFLADTDNLEFDDIAPVPEPATMLLFGTGLVGLVGSRLRKKKK